MSNFLIDEDTGLLAAEFVLGTLDSEERANARSLLRTDHGFIAMVRIWERRFGELHLMVEPVEPDAKILLRIKTKIAELPPREAVPEGKPAGSPAPLAAGLASAETPEPTDAANTGEATNTEEATKSDAEAAGETPKPPDAAADGTAPKPAEIAASGEAAMPAETPPDSGIAAVTETPPGPEALPPEGVVGPEGDASAKDAIPVSPAPSPPPPVKSPDKAAASRRDQLPENAIGVLRSRGRWRAFGIGMSLLAVGLVALVAAWRFVPDRLPAQLRPAELMISLGVQSTGKSGPVKPAPPESQFDE
jgi:hypothetical protein